MAVPVGDLIYKRLLAGNCPEEEKQHKRGKARKDKALNKDVSIPNYQINFNMHLPTTIEQYALLAKQRITIYKNI
jgi:hypothetical protein